MAREMKDSGIQWIGAIPTDWNCRRLRFLCKIQTGNQDTQDSVADGVYPFYVRSPIVERSNKFTFEGPAILMAGDGAGAGRIFHYVDGKYGCHQRVYSLQAITEINRRFLYYYLSNLFYREIEVANSKSTVDSVRLSMLQNFQVVFPDDHEQGEIVRYLDSKCVEIDAVLDKTRTSIEEYKKLKQAIITQAVTKGIRGDRPMKESGIEWVGEIPEEWAVAPKLSNLCYRSISYGIVKLFEPDDEHGVKVLRCSDILPGKILLNHVRTVKREVSDMYARTILQGGEVVINVRGTLGGCAVVSQNLCGYNVAREVAVIPVSNSVNNQFLMYYLLSDSFLNFESQHLLGSVYVGLNIALLSSCPIPCPPTIEQNEIVAHLNAECGKIDKMISKKEQLLNELESYKKSTIYEYVTGKKEVL